MSRLWASHSERSNTCWLWIIRTVALGRRGIFRFRGQLALPLEQRVDSLHGLIKLLAHALGEGALSARLTQSLLLIQDFAKLLLILP